MRKGEASPPRWRSILLLVGIAFSIALATYFSDPSGNQLSKDPGTKEASSPGSTHAPGGGTPARTQRLDPGPIASFSEDGLGSDRPDRDEVPGGSVATAGVEREVFRLPEEGGRPASVVSIQVIDAKGLPIPGVQVKLGDREAATDSAGEAILPQRSSDIELRHPEYFPRTIDPEMRRSISIPESETCERVTVVMFPGGRIAGRAVRPDGKPIAGVAINVDQEDGPSFRSDEEGAFRSPILRPGVHRLFFYHPGYQRTDRPVTIPSGGGEVQAIVPLRPGVPAELVVVDPQGGPVPDAEVWLIREQEGSAGEARFAGRTGDDGRLVVFRDAVDRHSARILVPGFREAVQAIALESTRVKLEKAPLISGQVIDRERGLPVKPSEVVLEVETAEGYRRAADRGVLFRSLAGGKFRVGLPPFPGTYRVRILAEADRSGASGPIAFDGRSDPPAVTIPLDRRTGLRGQVLASRNGGAPEPVAEARVELFRHDAGDAVRLAYGILFAAPPGPSQAVVTDAGGAFSFADLRPAIYRVRVLHPDFADFISAPVAVPSDAPLPCLLRESGSLRGAALGPDGRPEPGIPLVLVPQGSPFTRFTRSDDEGRYRFPNLSEGSYEIFAGDPRAEGPAIETRSSGMPVRFWGKSHRVAVRPGADVDFDIRRDPMDVGAVAGKLSTDGAPLANASIRVIPTGPGEAQDRTAEAGGTVQVPEAGSQEGRTVEAQQAAREEGAIVAGSRVDEAEARPAPAVAPVSDAGGAEGASGGSREEAIAKPLGLPEPTEDGSGRRTPSSPPDGGAGAEPAGPEIEVTTGPDGAFSIKGLQPGRYRISGGGLPVERTVEVKGGKTTELEIGLKTAAYRAVVLDGLRGGPVAAEGFAEIAPDRPDGRRSSLKIPLVNGKIEVPNLYPGTYRIRVEAAGFVSQEGRFELRGDGPDGILSTEIRLRPGNTLRVAILGADDRPFRGTGETVLLDSKNVEVHRSSGPIDGAVILPVLPPGSYVLKVRTEEGSTRLGLEVTKDAEVRARIGG